MVKDVKQITKTEIAKRLGISRSSLYYKSKREQIDLEIRLQIESVMTQNPYYGHKRIALALRLNKKRILRVMKKYNIKPLRKKLKFIKRDDIGKKPTGIKNLIEELHSVESKKVWVCDFTYLKYLGRFIYFAVVLDIVTREIVGFSISRIHNKSLVIDAFLDAVRNTGIKPEYIHSDQGSEYASELYVLLAKQFGVKISMSRKGSPWENGYVESFFGKFKQELGDLSQYSELVYLIEKIYHQVWYYNNERIHSSLKMSPVQFKKSKDSMS